MRALIAILLIVAVGVVAFLLLQSDERSGRSERTTTDPTRAVTETPAEGASGESGDPAKGKPLSSYVRGKLVNEEKLPVEGGTIQASAWRKDSSWGDVPGQAVSDASGVFEIAVPDRPWMQVKVRHPGYQAQDDYVETNTEEPVEIVLFRGAPVTVVVLAPDRAPIPGQKVRCQTARSSEEGWSWHTRLDDQVTGPDGRANIGVVGEGVFYARVDNPAYAPASVRRNISGLDPVEVEVVLDHGGAIEGIVTDGGGNPVEGARVHPRGDDARAASTDEKGHYRLEALSAKRSIRVMAEAGGYGPGFFGDSLGWGEAVPVTPRAGQTVFGIDIVLRKPSWVEGEVVDEKGKPVGGLSVHPSVNPSFSGKIETKTDADGRFRAGPYTLGKRAVVSISIDTRKYFLPEDDKQLDLEPGGTLRWGTITVSSKSSVRGTVYAADGTPQPKATVIGGGFVWSGTKPDGTFELTGLPPGRCWLTAWGRGETPTRAPRVYVKVEAGGVVEGVELHLREALTIAGHVRTPDNKPYRGADILLVDAGTEPPYDWDKGMLRSVSTEKDGSFEIGGLIDAEYDVGLMGEWTGEGMRFRESPPPQTVRAGSDGLDFVVPVEGGVIEGKVLSKRTGLPVPKFEAQFWKYAFFIPQSWESRTFESADGSFSYVLDEPGIYAVEIEADGHADLRTKTYKVENGISIDVGTIRLGDAGGIIGTVRDHAGGPVGWTRIHILNQQMQTNWGAPYTFTDGTYEIEDVSPGKYTVFAVSPRHPLAILRGLEVKEGKKLRVDIRFAASAPLEIQVLDEAGSPLPGADLIWTTPDLKPLDSSMASSYEPPGYGSNIADATGVIRKPYFPAGEVFLRIRGGGYGEVKRTVVMKPGKPERIEVRLPRKP